MLYIYIVKPGDTVQSISSKFGGWWQEFLATNLHVEFGGLKIGQTVYIPKHWINRLNNNNNNRLGVGFGIDDIVNLIVTPWSVSSSSFAKEGMYCELGIPCGSGLSCQQNICTKPGQTPTPGPGYNVPGSNVIIANENESCNPQIGTVCDSGLECSSDGICIKSGTASTGNNSITEDQCNQQGGQWDAGSQVCDLSNQPVSKASIVSTQESTVQQTSNQESIVPETPAKNESLLWWIVGGAVFVVVVGGTSYYLSKQNKSIESGSLI